MQVTKTSLISGVKRTKELDITEDQMNVWLNGGGLIQDVFPNLSDDDREFILTGCTPEEWEAEFGHDKS